MTELKLYVWKDYSRDYTAGMAVALAHDAEEARDLIAEEHGRRDESLANRPLEINLDEPVAFYVTGGG